MIATWSRTNQRLQAAGPRNPSIGIISPLHESVFPAEAF